MFNVGLIIILQSIVVEGFPTTEIWALGNLEVYQYLVAFPENKLARQEQINGFKYERQRVHWSAHTIGCKISQGIVC